MVFAMSAFALADSLIRLSSLEEIGRASAGQLLALQGTIGAFLYALLMRKRREHLSFELASNRYVLLRTASDIFAACCIVTALTLISVNEVSAILQVQPLVVTLGAVLFLGEKVRFFRWSAIIIGFIGVMIIMRPSPSSFENSSIIVLLGVIGLASRDLTTRQLPKQFSTIAVITFVSLAIIPAGILLHYFTADTSLFEIGNRALFLACLSSLVALIGYYALTHAMRIGEISVVAPYRYARLISAFFFAWLLLNEQPDLATILGSLIIVTAGIVVIYRENRLNSK